MCETMAGALERSPRTGPAPTAGINGDLEDWLVRNRPPEGEWVPDADIAPLPPPGLMYPTTGLTNPVHFAYHGTDFLRALSQLSPTPLRDYRAVLDFGAGVGRIARMFQGFRGRYVGVDIDVGNVAWLEANLAHVEAVQTTPRKPLPLADNSFDYVVSISVFSHLTEADQHFYLAELGRVAAPGAILMLSIHGARALERALSEDVIFEMLSIPRDRLEEIAAGFAAGRGYGFIRQDGHLTSATYEYGITFISPDYIKSEWGRYFEVLTIGVGALHDFQDVVVLKAR